MTFATHIYLRAVVILHILLLLNITTVSSDNIVRERIIPLGLGSSHDGRGNEPREHRSIDDQTDKRSISLTNLFFPGAGIADELFESGKNGLRPAKRADSGKEPVGNNLFRMSFDGDKEDAGGGSAAAAPSSDEDIVPSKRHNKHDAEGHRGPRIWDQWGKWSACTVSCGIGKITRWRHCVSGGCAPGEKEAQIKTCTMPAC